METKTQNRQINEDIYVFDVRYSDSYNPELMKEKNRTFRYIVDADGKEKIVVVEEKDKK